jgi:hypothetical protein
MSTSFAMTVGDEWTAHDAFGTVKPADRRADLSSATGTAVLRPVRGGYASFRVLVCGEGRFRLRVAMEGGLEADLYRAWYHPLDVAPDKSKVYLPDALVPARRGQPFEIPDPDNAIPGQTTQEFWVDVFVPPDATPGEIAGRVRLSAEGESADLPIRVTVLDAVLPDEPCLAMDQNSYGCRWLREQYPKALGGKPGSERYWHASSELIQNYFRVAHEHRTLFHNLGYGHSGQFDPIYGPRAVGRGRDRHLTDWDYFDRHHGPLLDGSAFATAAPGMPRPRQSARPIWAVYTPFNPDWPASYVNWGEPGYEVEFTRCMGEFDRHIRERGWTRTHLEFFFNHKKRYRWFEWDGDEAKFAKDDAYHLEMIRLWKKAVGDTPVKWVYRADVSWRMKDQFVSLGGNRNLWDCGGFCAWYPEEIAQVVARGEIVTWYGGYPRIDAASSGCLQNVYRTWARGLHGFGGWLTPCPGRDPWFACDGAATGVFYPGERFGIAGPIPSIRLKVLRNGIQDIDLLDQAAKRTDRVAQTRTELVETVGVPVWQTPPRVARELPPEDWDSANLGAEHEPIMSPEERLGPGWWNNVRNMALSAVAGKEAR